MRRIINHNKKLDLPKNREIGVSKDLTDSLDYTDQKFEEEKSLRTFSIAGKFQQCLLYISSVRNFIYELAKEIDKSIGDFTYDSNASAGGAASEALTITGLKATDTIQSVFQMTKGSLGTAYLSYSNHIDNGLTVEWTGDPGTGSIIKVNIKRKLTACEKLLKSIY